MSAQPLHGTVVASYGRAVLLRGPSGSGKSDLALRLIDRGFILVADDQVLLARAGGDLIAQAPPALAGLIELRGLGLVRLPYCPSARIYLVVDLVSPQHVERLPDPYLVAFLGLDIEGLRLHAFDATTALKISIALARPRLARQGPKSEFGLNP
jgi:serine kinase of HPr protein (carbohydrate metabolism regulator)